MTYYKGMRHPVKTWKAGEHLGDEADPKFHYSAAINFLLRFRPF